MMSFNPLIVGAENSWHWTIQEVIYLIYHFNFYIRFLVINKFKRVDWCTYFYIFLNMATGILSEAQNSETKK